MKYVSKEAQGITTGLDLADSVIMSINWTSASALLEHNSINSNSSGFATFVPHHLVLVSSVIFSSPSEEVFLRFKVI